MSGGRPLLGHTPGQLFWQAQRRKDSSAGGIPADLRRRIATRFPGLFEPVVPWCGPMSFLRWHAAQRTPET